MLKYNKRKRVWSYSVNFKKRLENIFNFYKKLYKLTTKLEFTNYLEDSFYDIEQDKIRTFLPLKFQRLKKLAFHSLYHEIKHAIDFYDNPKKIIKEIKSGNPNIERRAIYFSEKKVGAKYKLL